MGLYKRLKLTFKSQVICFILIHIFIFYINNCMYKRKHRFSDVNKWMLFLLSNPCFFCTSSDSPTYPCHLWPLCACENIPGLKLLSLTGVATVVCVLSTEESNPPSPLHMTNPNLKNKWASNQKPVTASPGMVKSLIWD